MKREDRIRRERFLKELKQQKKIADIKAEIKKDLESHNKNKIYVKSGYPENTDMSKLASQFVEEYKMMLKRKKAEKSTLIDHEEWLRRKIN